MATRLVVKGGNPLSGSMVASGAKNAALPIMAACLLARGEVLLRRVPDISDVWCMSDILRGLGAKVDYDAATGVMKLDTSNITTTTAPEELVRAMNASFDVAGPLLAVYGEASVALPGGCKLGPRPVDLHLAGFKKLGAEHSMGHGQVKVRCKQLTGGHILFPKVSVGATKNCLMAATLAKGETLMENCAKEPEIIDLANFLVKMGARIDGIGRSTMRVTGVEKLHGTEYSICADRVEVGTYLLGGALTQGDLTIEQCVPAHIDELLSLMQAAGQQIDVGGDFVRVRGKRPIMPLEITTEPYPGFPTDLHPQIVAMLTLAEGTSVLVENIFSGRFMYAMELFRLGANVRVNDRQVVVRGVKSLSGAPVDAPDIRAGGALVLAALVAEGESVITGVEYIDRGYMNIEGRLATVGADIKRISGQKVAAALR